MGSSGTHQITLRLPEQLYHRVKTLAKRRHTSINSLAREGLARLAEEELARKMRNAYEALGKATTESDTSAYFRAQSEVVRRG